jgi:folate-binding protein YgfZ
VLATLGVTPSTSGLENACLTNVKIGEVPCTLVELPNGVVPHFELWFEPEQVLAVWETLQAAGATACGLEAMEALRVLEAVPLYGIDLNDRDLPQETAQTRALNFSKGCYLGQEIVERIRSRGKVNRQFRQFALEGALPGPLPLELRSGEQAVGRITSVASQPQVLALGFIRVEVAERNQEISYEGGVAIPLNASPAITRSST